jgi:hypothetical protein
MSTTDFHSHTDFARRRRADERQHWLLLCALYPFFLVLAVAARLIPRARRGGSMFPGGRSVFAQARAAAATCIPFVFR